MTGSNLPGQNSALRPERASFSPDSSGFSIFPPQLLDPVQKGLLVAPRCRIGWSTQMSKGLRQIITGDQRS